MDNRMTELDPERKHLLVRLGLGLMAAQFPVGQEHLHEDDDDSLSFRSCVTLLLMTGYTLKYEFDLDNEWKPTCIALDDDYEILRAHSYILFQEHLVSDDIQRAKKAYRLSVPPPEHRLTPERWAHGLFAYFTFWKEAACNKHEAMNLLQQYDEDLYDYIDDFRDILDKLAIVPY